MCSQPLSLDKHVNLASKLFNSKTSFFEIYDNSSVDTCNRLIVIQPFGWIVLAYCEHVYIIKTHMEAYTAFGVSSICCEKTTLAMKLFAGKNKTLSKKWVCLDIEFADLLEQYLTVTPIVIEFEPDVSPSSNCTQQMFTVFDALAMLLRQQLLSFNTFEQRDR